MGRYKERSIGISRDTVQLAIKCLENPNFKIRNRDSSLVGQLVSSLKVYVGRGEFDGSLNSAVECLTLACYEIEGSVSNDS